MTRRITVYGVPMPQGSKTPFVRGGRAVLVDGRRPQAREAFKSWREAVASAARSWCAENPSSGPLAGPIALVVTFYLPRPASAPKRVVWPATRPDLDKLVRAVGDSLTGLLYADDARVVSLSAKKVFAVDRAPGAEIAVEPMDRAPVAARRGSDS